MHETNKRKLNRLVETFLECHSTSPGQRRCTQTCSSQQRTVRSQSNWNSNLEGLAISSQDSLAQAILLVQCTAVGLDAIEGRLRKSVQYRGQPRSRPPEPHPVLHLVPPVLHMVLLQHQHRQWIKPRKLPIPLEKPATKLQHHVFKNLGVSGGISAETENNNIEKR